MTNFMRVATFIMLVVSILGSICLAIQNESFLIFLLCCVGLFICYLPWFVMVEISDKIDYLSEQLTITEKNISRSITKLKDDTASNSLLTHSSISPVSTNSSEK